MAPRTEVEKRITFALARKTGSMELATRVVETGLVTIGGIHQDAAEEVAQTLATADSMVKAASYAGRITPEKKAAIARHTKDYMDDVLYITDDAAAEIVDVLLDGP